MKYLKIVDTGIQASRIGLGTWHIKHDFMSPPTRDNG